MSTGSKVALGVIAAIGIGTFTFWAGYVRAPSPEEICNRKVELITVEAEGRGNAQPLIDRLEATCVENANRRIQFRGRVKYAVYAKCVMKADNLENAERCSSVKK